MTEGLNGNVRMTTDKNQSGTNKLLRNEKINEIISNKPGFLIRWGITIFTLILLFIVGATFFIQYPDTLLSKAKLTSIYPPKEVKAKTNGKLVKLYAVEGQFVKQGELLGIMECKANYYEVINLTHSIDTLQSLMNNNQADAVLKYLLQPCQNIGELHKDYLSFLKKFSLFKEYLSSRCYLKIEKKLQSDDVAQKKVMFIQALVNLKSELDEWENTYFIIAPIDGVIGYSDLVQQDQELQNDQTICFINPQNPEYYVEVYIPQSKRGKVEKGQKILFTLQSHPSQEYGVIEGKLDFISNIATDNGFIARASLPNGLKTNYNKLVQYREGLITQAEIITADLKLSTRLINQMKGNFRN